MQHIDHPDQVHQDASDVISSESLERTQDSFLKNAWYVAGWQSEFESPNPTGLLLLNMPIVLYRKKAGELVALEDRCAHRWVPLSMGRVEGDDLRCMYHGVKYGSDGRCNEVPGRARPASFLHVRAYPVVERHRFVWVWMGDPALADPSLIPDLSMLEEPWRRLYRGSLDYNANYALINDNLLDLSHLAFLHERTLGRPVAKSTGCSRELRVVSGTEAKPIDRGVRAASWITGQYARTVVMPKNAPHGDFWTSVDFLVPGIFVNQFGIYDEGTADKCQGLAPGRERDAQSDSMSVMAVTPITARKSRYLFSVGPRASDMDQEEADAMWAVILEAFAEDLRFIEAQQRMIDKHPGRRMGAIEADRGLVLFRKLMRELILGEVSVAR